MSTLPITQEQRELFDALRNPDYGNFALMSCLVNGEPTTAICTWNRDPETGEYLIEPLFVAVTPGMALVDSDGEPTSRLG